MVAPSRMQLAAANTTFCSFFYWLDSQDDPGKNRDPWATTLLS
jgi:hypothetical protein